MTMPWEGKRVVVMGLGRFGGGVGVTRWLCDRGARVVVTDLAPAGELAESISQLKGLDVALHLGGHDERDLAECDLLVVNPAVPDEAPLLREARRRGIPWTTEVNLFLQQCPARVVGITGSLGKSTTAAMTAAALATTFTAHLGGNIGRSLLQEVAAGAIKPDHVVLLELSSFQLGRTPQVAISPAIAVVMNLRDNHLDRHGTMEAYAAAKKNIFRFQSAADLLIVNRDDPALAGWTAEAPGRTDAFGAEDEPFDLSVPGEHNQLNARAAWAAARALAVPRRAVAAALKAFRGLPHRLALVAEREQVRYYDDSKATTPTGAVMALQSFPPGTVVAIVGGYDKHLPLEALCQQLARRCRVVVATGQVGPAIAEQIHREMPAGGPEVIFAEAFDDAVTAAMRAAKPGDVVLLSPGCASYDQFPNYTVRGQRFAQLITRG